jgi:hypothetical protein
VPSAECREGKWNVNASALTTVPTIVVGTGDVVITGNFTQTVNSVIIIEVLLSDSLYQSVSLLESSR